MILNVVKVPDELLKQKSEPVKKFDEDLDILAKNMLETMYENNGVGLAAVQIGKLLKLIVIDIYDKEVDENIFQGITDKEIIKKIKEENCKNPRIFVNAEIVEKCGKDELMEEGCLSVPEIRDNVNRNTEVVVKYQDLGGSEKILKADGLLAHCLQHEIDHTNGIVFLDHLSKLKRDRAIKKLKKYGF